MQECTNAEARHAVDPHSCVPASMLSCISAEGANVISEIVEAEGHLIDSQLMNAMFDTVVRHDAAFDVLEFRIGRTNDEPSFVSMRVTAKGPARLTDVLEELVALGCRVA